MFGAALQQSQELMSAAEAAGPASAPLLLFYALAQAGRAICAAHASGQPWEPTSHGLKIVPEAQDIGDSQVVLQPKADASDAYSLIAKAIGSQPLSSSVQLSALWGALPDLAHHDAIVGSSTRAWRVVPSLETPVMAPMALQSRGRVSSQIAVPGVAHRDLAEFFTQYANTDGWQPGSPWQFGSLLLGMEDHGARAFWADGTSASGTPIVRSLDAIADHYDGAWYLRPLLGRPPAAPAPLLTWWTLLLALSSFARYHPASWTAALDVDRSPRAVELEEALRLAERRVPQLVLEALTVR